MVGNMENWRARWQHGSSWLSLLLLQREIRLGERARRRPMLSSTMRRNEKFNSTPLATSLRHRFHHYLNINSSNIRPRRGAAAKNKTWLGVPPFVLITIELAIVLCIFILLVETKAAEAAKAATSNNERQVFGPFQYLRPAQASQRRLFASSSSSQAYGGGGAPGRTQLAISVERVKNPDDDNKYKRKKFPVRWLRNQYPFNAYYNKKNKHSAANKSSYKLPADLAGQYSSNSFDVLDPNPATWVRIPERPTASIKFHKQQPSVGFVPPPIPLALLAGGGGAAAAETMAFAEDLQQFSPVTSGIGLPAVVPVQQQALSQMMTSESQNAGYSAPVAVQPLSGAPVQAQQAPKAYGPAEEKQGFGGISLSFGNGRSISFGGGQGLTIGGRAGAISIGGNGGSASAGSSGGADNAAAASGYSETKGGAGYQQQQQQEQQQSYGSNSYSSSNGYVNKYPTMSVDVPRKGKTIMHANLDMAPIKVRLHSSPRVKITTGSRDPLEKPGNEELDEQDEDIFEPPEPFPKRNATEEANNMTTTMPTNGTQTNETTTLSPIQLYGQEFGQNYGYQQQRQQQQQQHYASYGQQQQFVAIEQHANGYHSGQRPLSPGHYNRVAHLQQLQPGGYGKPPVLGHPQPYHGATFDEPPHFVNQQRPPSAQYQVLGVASPPQVQPPLHQQMQPDVQQQQQQQLEMGAGAQGGNEQTRAPEMNGFQQHQGQQFMQQPNGPSGVAPEQQQQQTLAPAVSQWRQFSREARQQQQQQLVALKQPPLDQAPDPNPRFYNGGNSLVSSPSGPSERNGKEPVASDLAASSSQQGAYAPVALQQMVAPKHEQFNPSTVYQMAPGGYHQPHAARPFVQTNNGGKTYAPQQESSYYVSQQRQQQPQLRQYSQNTNQQYAAYKQQKQHSEEAGYKTYTIGNGGISSSYGGGSSGGSNYAPPTGVSYGSGSHGSGGGGGGGTVPSDGFDQKNYQAKVEKFEPDAHDKRERTKVVLFLKPRISIHMANSSTTTKRPKNPQRFLHVVNRPIFLNTTMNGTAGANSSHHMEEEFIDPDLAEPMQIPAYGHGYGYGKGYGYGASSTRYYQPKTSTTKKPKPKTTTSTTTSAPTTASDSTESTTSSSTSSEGETTTTTTASPATTSAAPITSTASEASSTTLGDSSSTTESSSSSTTTSSDDREETSASPEVSSIESTSSSTTSSTEATSSSEDPESSSETPASSSEAPAQQQSSTEEPAQGQGDESSSERPASGGESLPTDNEAADLISAATEQAPLATTVTSAPTTTTTTSTTTTTTTARPATKTRARSSSKTSKPSNARKASTTTSSTTSSTTTTTSSTTQAPPATTAAEEIIELDEDDKSATLTQSSTTTSTTTEAPTTSDEPTASNEPMTTTTTTTTTTTGAPAAGTSELSEPSESSESSEPKEPSEMSETSSDPSTTVTTAAMPTGSSETPSNSDAKESSGNPAKRSTRVQHQPMLLNEELIDKLMRNKTLVGLMSSQLKRVINTDGMEENEKQRIVRQVFEQMMEKKVDFSMNNVRLAVKTVSSSYRAAAAAASTRTSSWTEAPDGETLAPIKSNKFASKSAKSTKKPVEAAQRARKRTRVDAKDFGRRSATSTTTTSSSSSSTAPSEGALDETVQSSPSLPAIDAALKLTKSSSTLSSGSRSAPAKRSGDLGGTNPIVVVLLPTEKKA